MRDALYFEIQCWRGIGNEINGALGLWHFVNLEAQCEDEKIDATVGAISDRDGVSRVVHCCQHPEVAAWACQRFAEKPKIPI